MFLRSRSEKHTLRGGWGWVTAQAKTTIITKIVRIWKIMKRNLQGDMRNTAVVSDLVTTLQKWEDLGPKAFPGLSYVRLHTTYCKGLKVQMRQCHVELTTRQPGPPSHLPPGCPPRHPGFATLDLLICLTFSKHISLKYYMKLLLH